ncbi:DUF3524 domain-containing protein [Pseudohongiella sp. SYSU M77423]|uniref:tRNA-queuosine alpha-mannosyltransferase domain-containing protein n=1 Tax=Pseudohongiella sp. SYSU M77423 TaxID=3042312 RepID=UPI0024802E82|nr:DUF3524 domain-containing protein [Pseudohongiella sp. SYSU M77423]MDH7943649.1 DUF3524 domain-containing protein [Pseudohongiella sp. SYSU M77423]
MSAYDAYSHQLWRTTLVDMFPQIDWTVLSLPPRYFAWRVRGNSLSWAFNHRDQLTDNYDMVLATSLTDLSALRGFVPELAQLPAMVYFHENQFAYPENRGPKDRGPESQRPEGEGVALVQAQLTSLYTALCADQVLFNSDWNRRSFFSGAGQLLAKLPDHVPGNLLAELQNKSQVLAVPLADQLFRGIQSTAQQERSNGEPLTIVWNHRHEYDKGPALLLSIVNRLCDRGVAFRLHLLGQRFRSSPAEFESIRRRLQQHYQDHDISPGVDEWVSDRQAYQALLVQSDIVLSTAEHDFQGLSVLEASILGCLPAVPDALAYPEYFASHFRYEVGELDHDGIALAAMELIQRLAVERVSDLPVLPPDLQSLSASALRPAWASALLDTIKRHKHNNSK